MEEFKNQLLKIESGIFNEEQLLSNLLLCVSNLEIDTVSEMARKLNKTPKGLKDSNNYRKIKIGKQTFVVNGLRDNNLPF